MNLPGYSVTELNVDVGVQYFFRSSGPTEIVKIIDYSIVDTKHDIIKTESIFNLGFADLDINTGEIRDDEISNNGDVYKVFYTVLNTIPSFFEKYPYEAIVVSGSDSKDSFAEKCFKDCKKRCPTSDLCKNKDRRVNVYMMYLNKNFASLTKEYSFFGGIGEEIEPYEPQKKYKSVFVTKNK